MWNLLVSEGDDGEFLGDEGKQKWKRFLAGFYIFAIKYIENYTAVLGQILFTRNNIYQKTPNWGI